MTDDPLASRIARPRSAWLTANLVAQIAFGLLAMTICLPSMPDWARDFGASQAAVQLTFSAYVAAFGILQLVYGAWSDLIGRKPVLLAGLALAVLGSIGAALAPDLAWLTLSRICQGAGAAAGMVLGRAMVQDLFTGAARTRTMAFVGMTMGLCPPLAMLVGGWVHVRYGWAMNFWLIAALGGLLMLAAWRGLPGTKPAHRHGPVGLGEAIASYRRLLGEPVFRVYVALLAVSAATFYTFLGGAPIVLAGYGVSPERMGWYIMSIPIAYVFGNLLTTRLTRRVGDGALMLLGHVCTIAAILTVLALGLAGYHTPLALAVPLVLLGIGHGLFMPPALSGTVGIVPALAGSAAAVGGLMQQVTGALGGMVVGLVPHVGPVNLALQMLAWASAGLATVLWLRRARPAPSKP